MPGALPCGQAGYQKQPRNSVTRQRHNRIGAEIQIKESDAKAANELHGSQAPSIKLVK